MVVIHYTAMDSADAACRALCDPARQVSAHYLIDQDGSLRSLVDENMRAWHAGAGAWGNVTDVNSRSIGIEISNDGDSPFNMLQMDALCTLLHGITTRWAIRPERIIGHSCMAPGRKIDPGRRFDWRRLWREGLGVWPDMSRTRALRVSESAFAAQAATFGFVHTSSVQLLYVMRMRFRPMATGPLDATDMAIITDLATRFPVDAMPPTS